MFQEGGIFGCERAASPQRGSSRGWIEILERIYPGAGPVMIPADDRGDIRFDPVRHPIRIRAVTHQVTQTEDFVVASACLREHGFESLHVAVNVAED